MTNGRRADHLAMTNRKGDFLIGLIALVLLAYACVHFFAHVPTINPFAPDVNWTPTATPTPAR